MIPFDIHPRRVASVCIAAAMLLVACYLATQYYRIRVAPAKVEAAMKQADWPQAPGAATSAANKILNPRGLVKLFDLDAEANLPSIWSVLQLCAAAGLLAIVARHRKHIGDRTAIYWFVLALGFVVLALDEGASLHSSMYVSSSSEAVRKARGIFYFTWVIPALIIAALVGIAFLRFLWMLPTRTRWLFIIAGVWYVASAAGGEMVQGWWEAHTMGRARMGWVAITILEEAGEMLSISWFIHSALCYMRDEKIAVSFSVSSAAPAAVAAPAGPGILPPLAEPTFYGDEDDDAAPSLR